MQTALIWRAMKCEIRAYTEASADPGYTGIALAVAVSVAAAHAIGAALRARIYGWADSSGILLAFINENLFWLVAAAVIFGAGRFLLRRKADPGAVLRAVALSTAPGAAILAASALPAVGIPAEPLLAAVLGWRLLAMYAAVRAALDLDSTRSVLLVFAATVTGFSAVGAGTRLITSLLG